MAHRLPSATESRVLLALYHKGPLRRVQLVNLEAIPVGTGPNQHVLLSLVEKTLIACRHGPQGPYELTQAGYNLTEVCVKHDLMVETGYRSDALSREVARGSEVRRDFLEGEFKEVRREPNVAKAEPPAGPLLRVPRPVTPPPPPPVKPKPARVAVPPPRIYSSVPRR